MYSPHPSPLRQPIQRALCALALGLALALSACVSKPPAPPVVRPVAPPAAPPVAVPPIILPPPVVEAPPALQSQATSDKAYRQDGARHIYQHNSHRIFKGPMPPLLQAVGVLQIEVDRRGNVNQLYWMRAPSHVPHVMREIERTVRAAAPFPAPVRLGRVTYTDVWLWDQSGNFQLDTLTEGQRNR